MSLLRYVYLCFIIKLVSTAPKADTLFDHIAAACPNVRNNAEFKNQPLLTETCEDFGKISSVKTLDESTRTELHCQLYYSAFLFYCFNNGKIQGNAIYNKTITNQYKIDDVCDDDLSVIPGDVKKQKTSTISKIIQNKEDCIKLCSDELGDLEKVCAISYYYMQVVPKYIQPQTTVGVIDNVEGAQKSPLKSSVPELPVKPQIVPPQPEKVHDKPKDSLPTAAPAKTIEKAEVELSTKSSITGPNAEGPQINPLKKDTVTVPVTDQKKNAPGNDHIEGSPQLTQNPAKNHKQDAADPNHLVGGSHIQASNNGAVDSPVDVPDTPHVDTDARVETQLQNDDDDDAGDEGLPADVKQQAPDVIPIEPAIPKVASKFPQPDVSQAISYDPDEANADSPFFTYFMFFSVIVIVGYVCYHNKNKILALMLEGQKSRRPQRGKRPNSANYHKLDSNLEEAITSSCSKNTSHVIY